MTCKVTYPYRNVRRRDRALFGYDSLTLDEQQDLFDREHGIPVRDGVSRFSGDDIRNVPVRDAGEKVDTSTGGSGGLCTEKDDRALYVNKNNYNPPISTTLSKKYYPNEPIEALSLPEVREWCRTHTAKDDYVLKSGEAWTAPDCTVGVLRRIASGQVSGFVPCGSWSCDYCGPIKRDRLAKRATEAFEVALERSGDPDAQVYFLTLNLRVPVGKQKVTDANTLHVDGYRISGYVEQIYIAQCFQRFRSILNKKGYFTGATGEVTRETKYVNKFGTECLRTTRARLSADNAYFYVKEFSPPSHAYNDGSGRVTAGNRRHYHIMTNFDVPDDVLQEAWWYATNKTSVQAYMVRDTEEHGKLRASYITKYINKSMTDSTFVADYLPLERRYGKSVGFFSMIDPPRGVCYFQLLRGIQPPP